MKRSWFVYVTEYPEDGAVLYEHVTMRRALKLAAQHDLLGDESGPQERTAARASKQQIRAWKASDCLVGTTRSREPK